MEISSIDQRCEEIAHAKGDTFEGKYEIVGSYGLGLLKNITRLHLEKCVIMNFKIISTLNLISLQLQKCNLVESDMEYIAMSPARYLDISENHIENGVIHLYRKYSYLNVSVCKLKKKGLKHLASLEVEILDLSCNSIGNAIDYFTRDYKELHLVSCKISSVTKIGNIGLLVLHNNYLTDVSHIATKQITRLNLSHNKLTSCVLPKVYMVLDLEGNNIPRSDIDKCTARWYATKYGMISTYPNRMHMVLAPYFPAVIVDIIIDVHCCDYC